jgi:hypothetical protein
VLSGFKKKNLRNILKLSDSKINFKQDGGEMKRTKVMFGFVAVISLIFIAYAFLKTVPSNLYRKQGVR